jgi:hypothetical protein
MGAWNTAFQNSPAGSKGIGTADDELRAIKKNLRDRLLKYFHFPLDDENLQMSPKAGIAIPFTQSSAPTTRPDGTNFTTEDVGRLWLKNEYGAFTINEPIGLYYLASADGAGTNTWRKMPSNMSIGSVKIHYGVFTEASAGDPYDTGTDPGWFIADGKTLDVAYPCGALTVPDFNDGTYLRTLDITGTVTSQDSGIVKAGDNEAILTTANLPPHTHVLLSDGGNALVEQTDDGAHTHEIDGYKGTDTNEPNKLKNAGNNDFQSTSTTESSTHIHDIEISGSTEDNDVGDTMASDPVTIEPEYTEVMLLVRMY